MSRFGFGFGFTPLGTLLNQKVYLPFVDEPSFTSPTSGSIRISDPVSLNMYDGAGNDAAFWVSFWAKIGADSSYYLVSKAREFGIQVLGGRINFLCFNQATTTARIGVTTANTQQAAIAGAWHHIVCVYDGSKAYTGMAIYVDKVKKSIADTNTGSYVNMSYYSATTEINVGTSGELCDFKIGSGTLTEQQRTDLYDCKVNGTEIINYPCSEGYGTVIHNVSDQNFEKHGTIIGTGSAWDNTQDFFHYNYTNGGTKVDDYFFPNLSDKSKSFTPLDVVVLAGQSNAEGAGVNAELAGTDYEVLTNTAYRTANAYQYIGGFMRKMDFTNCFTTVGVDDILAEIYTQLVTDLFVVKHGPGSTGLAAGSSAVDWNPATTGEHFDTLAGYISTQLTLLFKNGREPFIKSFLWIQGERDAAAAEYANAYYTNLAAFFTKWGTLLPGVFNIQISQLSIQVAAAETPGDTIRAAQALFVTNNANSQLIDTSDATTNDGTHYDSEYLISIAEMMKANFDSAAFADSKSYIHKILPGYVKTYYDPNP